MQTVRCFFYSVYNLIHDGVRLGLSCNWFMCRPCCHWEHNMAQLPESALGHCCDHNHILHAFARTSSVRICLNEHTTCHFAEQTQLNTLSAVLPVLVTGHHLHAAVLCTCSFASAASSCASICPCSSAAQTAPGCRRNSCSAHARADRAESGGDSRPLFSRAALPASALSAAATAAPAPTAAPAAAQEAVLAAFCSRMACKSNSSLCSYVSRHLIACWLSFNAALALCLGDLLFPPTPTMTVA